MISSAKLPLFSSIPYSWQYPYNANELGTSWNHVTGQNDNLWVRISRSLNGYEQTDIETLKQNNIILRDKLMGLTHAEYEELINPYNAVMNDKTRRLEAGDVSYRNFSKNGLDIIKYNNNSNSRCRNNSPRGTLKTKLKDMRHRDTVNKSNESLDLNYCGHDQEKEVVRFINYGSVQSPSKARDDFSKDGGAVHTSTSCTSVESLFEGRNDVSDDQEGISRMTESSTYRTVHTGSCIITAADIDDEVCHYLDKLLQEHKSAGSRKGGLLKNTALGKMFKKQDPKVGSEGLLPASQNKVQVEEVAKTPRRLFSAWTHTLLTREKLVTVTAAMSAFNIIELYLYLVLGQPIVCVILLLAVASTIAIMLPVLLFRFCRRKRSGMSNNILSE
ncbi:hypothetical protein AK88_05329 [Plasmodium fragile]|uniref:Uncharacterized protein n=1 Tax=Plasmodium fragile TaxID=5857 RepID=A0A0D9QDA4_PLAFR|nr:uncharacterized protein AK88_05329 [Plasmodium fragile]KJP85045.1 hypothetical protein AK88_05329 [Plasmodium fragile]